MKLIQTLNLYKYGYIKRVVNSFQCSLDGWRGSPPASPQSNPPLQLAPRRFGSHGALTKRQTGSPLAAAVSQSPTLIFLVSALCVCMYVCVCARVCAFIKKMVGGTGVCVCVCVYTDLLSYFSFVLFIQIVTYLPAMVINRRGTIRRHDRRLVHICTFISYGFTLL